MYHLWYTKLEFIYLDLTILNKQFKIVDRKLMVTSCYACVITLYCNVVSSLDSELIKGYLLSRIDLQIRLKTEKFMCNEINLQK